MSQILMTLIWYLMVTAAGYLTLPLAFRFLKFLPDRGFTFSRSLGLLLWGYIFWLLTTFGLLQNNAGGVLFGLILLAGVSAFFMRGGWFEFKDWFGTQRRLILTAESLFLIAYLSWTVVRAANPEIIYTEKPMELAFINAILRSPSFPPFDPWLAGYAISYYYFGYVIVAMLIHLSGVPSSIGFNLGIAMWFGLTALAAYGVLFNLLSGILSTNKPAESNRKAVGWALLAPLFILIVSNLSGLLDILHARGIFWQRNPQGVLESSFWKWLGIQEFDQPPPEPLSWTPKRTYWLWWRGSRVLQDFNLLNQREEVIDEFPFFSYLLADMHPHVLGMPFVLLAAGLALNFYFSFKKQSPPEPSVLNWLKDPHIWLSALIFGGLSFLNTWDFPIYLGLFAGVYVFYRYLHNGWGWQRVGDFVFVAITVGILGILLYLPFYLGFSSQAGGFLPSLIFHTRGVHFWVMFAPLLLPILFWLLLQGGGYLRPGLRWGVLLGSAIVAAGWILMLIASKVIELAGLIGQTWMTAADTNLARMGQTLTSLSGLFFIKQGGSGTELFQAALLRRISAPGTWLTLMIILIFVFATIVTLRRLYGFSLASENDPVRSLPEEDQNRGFVLLLILLGAGLTLAPEFFYLQDDFGTRMNTIFKFYFQTWILWGIAAAYSSAILLQRFHDGRGGVVKIVWVILMACSLIYPGVMLPAKTGLLRGQPVSLTLDGKAYLQRDEPDEWQAFQFLWEMPLGNVVEAVGPQYNPQFARVATHAGQPGLLGWEGHEIQWRGTAREMGSRRVDIETLYQTSDWLRAREIIQQYGIRYIYIGPVERSAYRVSENKFSANLGLLFANSNVRIYEVPDALVEKTP
ncbi:protein containing Chlor_Arch_YYY domain [Bellilinea caldifistulae]|uniref:YYY membrane protein n=1 Tax=Bellilinea caldifistulae TaxID=360411 RepID=A0A0P6X6A3_9CHLR|nr:DUF2298 domain-containing protein [Bellilinea caldifistulae]KPL74896.1 hypothetical protein AC812_10230 [Bellilinea caldifistulae]GAP10518.1 protein containing Chlor_Arch_YYY domain [Bellilinea caldifistulae]